MKGCAACQVLMINGLRCHETGCTEAWRDRREKCKCCGKAFRPKERRQSVCSMRCHRDYWGG
jgi:hypothetical protein